MSTRISDILRSPNNEPLTGITIRLVATETSGKVVKTVVAEVTTAADGRYTLDVPAGLYDVYLERYGHRKEKAGTIRIYDDSPANTLNYYLEAPKDAPLPSWIRLIETSTSEAKTAAGEAGQSAAVAKASADDAEASHLKVKAIASDVGKAITDNISSSAPQAGKVPRSNAEGKTDANWLAATAYARTEADMEAMRAANRERYAASGPVHMGKHSSYAAELPINQGLHTLPNTEASHANTLRWGRAHENEGVGESKTDYPVFHIAGFEAHLSGVGLDDSSIIKNVLHFPQAPDGTVTYDSSTGEITNFMTDTDAKYGDVASSRSEAVARAWEGDIKNGDFRNGTDDWSLGVNCSVSDGVLRISGAANVSNSQYFEWEEGVTYEVIINVKALTEGVIHLYKYGVGAKDVAFGSINKQGVHRFVVSGSLGSDNFGKDNLFNMFIPTGSTTAEVDYVSIRKVTDEVATNRVDLFGIEFFLRKVDSNDPWLYPYGCLCSNVSSIDGVVLEDDNKPDSYHAMYKGQTNDIYRKALNVSTANDATLATFMANPKNNVFRMANGDLVQWTIRARTIAGAGNGDWKCIRPESPDSASYLKYAQQAGAIVKAQGTSTSATSMSSGENAFDVTANGHNKFPETGIFTARDAEGISYNGECYFYVVGTVPRLNQGAYHPSLNPFGASLMADSATGSGLISRAACWYEDLQDGIKATSQKDLFIGVKQGDAIVAGYNSNTGKIGSSSGRPDGKSYDAIYASGQGGFIDERLKFGAWDASSTEQKSVVIEEIKNGTYLGRQSLTFTKCESTAAANSNSSAYGAYVGDIIEWSVGDKISVVLSGTVLIKEAVVTDVLTSTVNWDSTLYGTYSRADGTVYDLVHTYKTDITVEGEFSQTDVIGDPAEILKTPALANGWLGSWIPVIPDGTSKDYPLTRKSLSSTVTQVGSGDLGATWNSITAGGYSTVTNLLSARTYALNSVIILNRTAFAKQTEQSANVAVLNRDRGLSRVWQYNGYFNKVWGACVLESTLDFIGKNTVGNKLSTQLIVTEFEFYEDKHFLSAAINNLPKHSALSLVAPTNDSHAAKFLFHQIEENNQANLNIISNELIHNGTDWGDDSTMKVLSGTFTDKNGNTCKSSIHKLAKPYGWIKNEC